MNGIIKWSLKNNIAIFLLIIVVVISGIVSTGKIKMETFPNVSNPVLTVQARQPGATAEDIETELTNPLENAIKGMNDFESFTSTSGENVTSLTVTYPFGTDLDKKEQQLNSAISRAGLPNDAEVQVSRVRLEDLPVYTASLSTKNEAELQDMLENEIVPELEQTEGVSKVELLGTNTSEVEIKVNIDAAEAKGISLNTIKQAIQKEQYSLPAGSAESDGTTIAVRLTGSFKNIEDLKKITISNPGLTEKTSSTQMSAKSGLQQQLPLPIKLGDIAEINTITRANEINKVNGENAFQLRVTKDQNANTTDVSQSVRHVLANYQKKADFSIHTILDQGKESEDSVASLTHESLYGALFVVIVIALFLRNFRATIIALISIPISILTTLSLLNPLGYTLNIMTLGGMAVAVGRIVDDSIVVIENIFRWKQQKGSQLSLKELAFHATKEVATAVASSTLVTVVVFLPLAFISGMIGEFFRPFAVTVVISIIASVLVAFLLIPVLGASFFKKVKHRADDTWLSRTYTKLLQGTLQKKAIVIIASIILLVGSLALIPKLGFSFLPGEATKQIEAKINLPSSTTLTAIEEVGDQIDNRMKELNLFDKRQMTVGISGNRGMRGGTQTNEQTIDFTLTLKKDHSIDKSLDEVEKEILNITEANYPLAKVTVKEGQSQGPGSGNNLDVKLYGENAVDLRTASRQVEDLLKENTGLKNISNEMQETRKAWEIALNDTGKDLGLSPEQTMAMVSEHLQPLNLGDFYLDGKDQPILLEYDQKISTEDKLKNILLSTPAGKKRLGELADIHFVDLPAAITHENGKTYTQVQAVFKDNDTLKATQKIKEEIESLSLPKGVSVTIGGGEDDITEGLTSLGMAIGAAIGLVFIILSVTYGGLLTPLIILSSLLFVPIGAITGLLVTNQPVSMSSMIGLLMLVGIVVTNSIVLLDRVETKRKAGMELNQALIEAAKTRMRPILMTAFATICALIPLALSTDSSLLISQGLAITVIGGLTTSTLLTLIVVPVLYSVFGKYRRMEKNNFISN